MWTSTGRPHSKPHIVPYACEHVPIKLPVHSSNPSHVHLFHLICGLPYRFDTIDEFLSFGLPKIKIFCTRRF